MLGKSTKFPWKIHHLPDLYMDSLDSWEMFFAGDPMALETWMLF
jgi:hypothetical protein